MRRYKLLVLAVPLFLVRAPALGQPGELLRKVRQAAAARLLYDASEEEREALKALKAEFLQEARSTLKVLRGEARGLLGSVKGILTDEQQVKAKELAGRLRELPLRKKIALLRRFLGSLRGEEMGRDAALWLSGSAEERVQAGDRIASRIARALIGVLGKKVELTEEQGEAILKSLEGTLQRTRAERSALLALGREKLLKARDILTPEQRTRIEKARDFVLGWLRGGAPR